MGNPLDIEFAEEFAEVNLIEFYVTMHLERQVNGGFPLQGARKPRCQFIFLRPEMMN